jgi:hypothetical protein
MVQMGESPAQVYDIRPEISKVDAKKIDALLSRSHRHSHSGRTAVLVNNLFIDVYRLQRVMMWADSQKDVTRTIHQRAQRPPLPASSPNALKCHLPVKFQSTIVA